MTVSEPIAVHVHASDPISLAGVVSHLRPRPEVKIVGPADVMQAKVILILADKLDEHTVGALRQFHRAGHRRIVLMAANLDEADVVNAAEAGVVALVRRSEASAERMVAVLTGAATGEGTVPADLLGKLLGQVGRLQRHVLSPRGMMFNGLAPREVEVLRLLADGFDTQDIAKELCYSERTVKNVVHDVTSRLQLRNRSHAVAYALREGLS